VTEGQGPVKGPTTSALKAKRTTRHHIVTAGAIRLDIAVDGWHFAYVVDADPPSGLARDIAQTVIAVTGCDSEVALAAVLAAFAPLPVGELEEAA
jgi:hypothetical protein